MTAHGKPDLARTIRLLLLLNFLSSLRGAAAQHRDSTALAETADTLSWPCSNDDVTQRDEIRKTYGDSGNDILKLREELDYKRATTYAPVLRFAPGERYYPTLPFFTAFDTLQRQSPWSKWGPGYSSVIPMGRFGLRYRSWRHIGSVRDHWMYPVTDSVRRKAKPSFDPLTRKYLTMSDPGLAPYQARLPVRAVLYRVCDIVRAPATRVKAAKTPTHPGKTSTAGLPRAGLPRDDAAAVWRYLRSDEQAWHRFGLDTLTARSAPPTTGGDCPSRIPDSTGFRVIQYFFYYVADQGLEGHPNDLESVLIFTPRVAGYSDVSNCFRIIVGAGHDDPAPNNVLVMLGHEASRKQLRQPNVLVEFGGHSSAPDMPPFGQFSAGLDVNWHIDDLWGTRDMQASGGVSYTGRYQGTMTYPRDPEDAVTLVPKDLQADTKSLLSSLVRLSAASLAKQANDLLDSLSRDSTALDTAAVRTASEMVEERYRSVGLEWQGMQYEGKGSDSLFVNLTSSFEPAQSTGSLDTLRAGRIAQMLDSLWKSRLSLASTPDSIANDITHRARAQGAAPRAIRDTAFRVLASVWQRRDSTRADLRRSNRIVDRFTAIEDAKLLPRYTLIPVTYLRSLYQAALDYRISLRPAKDPTKPPVSGPNPADTLGRYLLLIAGAVNDSLCVGPPACGLSQLDSTTLRSVVDAIANCRNQPEPQSLVCQVNRAGGHVDSATAVEIARWNDEGNLWKSKSGDAIATRISTKVKYKPWEHTLYKSPADIFRTHLFRPTVLQSAASARELSRLLTLGVTVLPNNAVTLNYGFIIPTIHILPFRIPGYLQVQLGPSFSWFDAERTKVGFAGSLVYDSRFVYLWGWFLRATASSNRALVEGNPKAHWLTLTAGPSLWFPFAKPLHLRTGLRFDMRGGTPRFSTAGWSFEVDFHQ